jgi:uncharacterized membrane protein YqjE
MNETSYARNHERSIGSVAAEIRDELKDFIQTRVRMFKAELRETLATFKQAVPMAIVAIVLLATAYILLTLAVVGVVAVTFWNNPYRWFFSFLIVGLLWLIAGALTAFLASKRFRAHGMFPKRTLGVLKADKVWFEHEARSQL